MELSWDKFTVTYALHNSVRGKAKPDSMSQLTFFPETDYAVILYTIDSVGNSSFSASLRC